MSRVKIDNIDKNETTQIGISEITDCEQSMIVGGLDPDDGALAIIGLGIAAAAVTSVTAPAVAAAALVIGIGILLRDL
jgi:hypothetical protein